MKSTDEIMGWIGREYSHIEPYCDGYLWVLEGRPNPTPDFKYHYLNERKSLQEGIEAGYQALNHSANRYSSNRVKAA